MDDIVKETKRNVLARFVSDVLKHRLDSSQTLALMKARDYLDFESVMLARAVLAHFEQGEIPEL